MPDLGLSKADDKLMPDPNHPPADHILAFAQTLRGGGVERALLRLATGWVAEGRRVTLVIGDPTGPLAAELPAGAGVETLGTGEYGALAAALAERSRALRPDVIFCPGNHYTGAAARAWWRLGRAAPPIVGKVSNALVRADLHGVAAWGYRHWLRLHPRFLSHVVAMTPGMAREAMQAMGMAEPRVSVIPNPPALPIVGAAPVALPDGRFLLGVGRLEPQKRWDRLIAALPRLAADDVRLVILGEGSLRGTLEAQVAALGLRDRVLLPGHAADPLPAMARAAAVVLTSDYEGVPGALGEALALGTPVVTTDSTVAVREIVRGPEFGHVVARDDMGALVAALDHWLAPGRSRPAPLPPPGATAVTDYLRLFDRLVQPSR